MRLWLGVDVETTGLSSTNDRITELGAVLWDLETNRPIDLFNSLVYTDHQISELITKLTGIDREMLDKYGRPEDECLDKFLSMAKDAECIVAHNAPFDRGFIEESIKRTEGTVPDWKWVDSQRDIPYPETIKGRKLVHLAAEHDFLNPFAHRALFDVLTMMRVVSQYSPDEILYFNESPTIHLRAMVNFDGKELAKARGYRWEAQKKWWVKTIKEFQKPQELTDLPFEVKEVKL